nr:helix-turn-helix transcriptional regulator [Thalassobaculum litoreum]
MVTGTQIRMARAAVGWSTRKLADDAGVHHNTVSRIERGEPTNKGTLLLLQQALEAAGVEFIPENGGGAGVRLTKN